jgi:hypothetical protein
MPTAGLRNGERYASGSEPIGTRWITAGWPR